MTLIADHTAFVSATIHAYVTKATRVTLASSSAAQSLTTAVVTARAVVRTRVGATKAGSVTTVMSQRAVG